MDLLSCQYIVVKYVPNIVRDEAVNIGIILHCSQTGANFYKFPSNFNKLSTLYPESDKDIINSFVNKFKSNSSLEFDKLNTFFGYHFAFSEARGCLTDNPAEELTKLYLTFIYENNIASLTQHRDKRFRTRLKDIFNESRILDRVDTKGVFINGRHTSFKIDFQYINSRPNLIQPISFSQKEMQERKEQEGTAIIWQYRFNEIQHIEGFESSNIIAVVEPPRKKDKMYTNAVSILKESPAEILDFNTDSMAALIKKIEREAHLLNVQTLVRPQFFQ